jgi:hypothetical protein
MLINEIKKDINKETNKIKEGIKNGFIKCLINQLIIQNKEQIDKYNEENNKNIDKIKNEKLKKEKIIKDMIKHKTKIEKIINMEIVEKEMEIFDGVFNNMELIKKYIYIIEITKILIYIIQNYININTDKRINRILEKKVEKIHKFIKIGQIERINKDKGIYNIIRSEAEGNDIKGLKLGDEIRNIVLLYETIVKDEIKEIYKDMEYIEEIIRDDIDYYLNFGKNCYNEYVKKYDNKTSDKKHIYYEMNEGKNITMKMRNDIKERIQMNIENKIDMIILIDKNTRSMIYGTKKERGILTEISNIRKLELKDIRNINTNEKIMDIEIKKKEDLYIVEKSILNNIIKEDIEIMEEYKINEMEISIITCNNRKETQEEMIKERKTNSIIKKKNENMNLINIIREKWNKRWMYIKNIDNSNLDNVMKNIQ